MSIEDYIPFGAKNAVTRGQLCIQTGLSDRKIRELIEKSNVLIINLGSGYFQPLETEERLVRSYWSKEAHRMKSQKHKFRKIELWLAKKHRSELERSQMTIFDFIGGESDAG